MDTTIGTPAPTSLLYHSTRRAYLVSKLPEASCTRLHHSTTRGFRKLELHRLTERTETIIPYRERAAILRLLYHSTRCVYVAGQLPEACARDHANMTVRGFRKIESR